VKTRTLSAKNVLQLIKACKENNVTELKFGDFCLRFDAQTNAIEDPTPTATIPEEVPKASHAHSVSEDERKLADEKEDVAMLTIEDPLLMEEMIAKGELVDEAT
jgi:hypothetical protein